MRGFLIFVCVVSWLVAAYAFLTIMAGGTDIQLILAGVYGTMGTVALAGAGIMEAIERLHPVIEGKKAVSVEGLPLG